MGRLLDTKMNFLVLIGGCVAIAIPFTGLWFLGDWLSTTSIWWLKIPVRIIQWALGAMGFGFTIYWLYQFFKTLIIGKGIED